MALTEINMAAASSSLIWVTWQRVFVHDKLLPDHRMGRDFLTLVFSRSTGLR